MADEDGLDAFSVPLSVRGSVLGKTLTRKSKNIDEFMVKVERRIPGELGTTTPIAYAPPQKTPIPLWTTFNQKAPKRWTACKKQAKLPPPNPPKRWASILESEEGEDTANEASLSSHRHSPESESAEDDSDDDCQREQDDVEQLVGCSLCLFRSRGCRTCRLRPCMSRKKTFWKPEEAVVQTELPPALTFHPTDEEFSDPYKYISSIRSQAEKTGICKIVPPKSWRMMLRANYATSGVQPSHINHSNDRCKEEREDVDDHDDDDDVGSAFTNDNDRDPQFTLPPTLLPTTKFPTSLQPLSFLQHRDPHYCAEDVSTRAPRSTGSADGVDGSSRASPSAGSSRYGGDLSKQHGFGRFFRSDSADEDPPDYSLKDGARHSVQSLQAFDRWFRDSHFSRPSTPHDKGQPGLTDVEAELWRIVSNPSEEDAAVHTLYAHDIDTAQSGSGFTKNDSNQGRPNFRQNWKRPAAARAAFAAHPFNLNNLPNQPDCVLGHLNLGNSSSSAIQGITQPWMYIGTTMSVFCWHTEDHYLYSTSYLHTGAPKVWYGIPGHAADKFARAMRREVPDLFSSQPNLLHQLNTLVAPSRLAELGVPVYRIVHTPGTFIVTFPRAFHCGVNTGLNCAEAVNFATLDWLKWGQLAFRNYCLEKRKFIFPQDKLLLNIVRSATNNVKCGVCRGDNSTVVCVCETSLHNALPVSRSLMVEAGKYLWERLREETESVEALVSKFSSSITMIGMSQAASKFSNRKYKGGAQFVLPCALGAIEDLDCSFCQRDIYLSFVMSKNFEDVYACPACAAMPGSFQNERDKDMVWCFRYTFVEFRAILEKLSHVLECKSESGGTSKPWPWAAGKGGDEQKSASCETLEHGSAQLRNDNSAVCQSQHPDRSNGDDEANGAVATLKRRRPRLIPTSALVDNVSWDPLKKRAKEVYEPTHIRKKSNRNPLRPNVGLTTLISYGIIDVGEKVLRCRDVAADLEADGAIVCRGQRFQSPSAFAAWVKCVKADNGWSHVTYRGQKLEYYRSIAIQRLSSARSSSSVS